MLRRRDGEFRCYVRNDSQGLTMSLKRASKIVILSLLKQQGGSRACYDLAVAVASCPDGAWHRCHYEYGVPIGNSHAGGQHGIFAICIYHALLTIALWYALNESRTEFNFGRWSTIRVTTRCRRTKRASHSMIIPSITHNKIHGPPKSVKIESIRALPMDMRARWVDQPLVKTSNRYGTGVCNRMMLCYMQ